MYTKKKKKYLADTNPTTVLDPDANKSSTTHCRVSPLVFWAGFIQYYFPGVWNKKKKITKTIYYETITFFNIICSTADTELLTQISMYTYISIITKSTLDVFNFNFFFFN